MDLNHRTRRNAFTVRRVQPLRIFAHMNCPTAFNDVRAWSIINNLGGDMGVEPIHNVVTAHRVHRFTNLRKLSLEPHERIELSTSAWKAEVLLLYEYNMNGAYLLKIFNNSEWKINKEVSGYLLLIKTRWYFTLDHIRVIINYLAGPTSYQTALSYDIKTSQNSKYSSY